MTAAFDPVDLQRDVLLSGSIQESVELIARAYQVDYFTFHLFRPRAAGPDSPFVRTNYPNGWVSHYLLNDYIRIDPVVAHAFKTEAPFCWSALVLDRAQLGMMQTAVQMGLGLSGFSVPHRDKMGRLSLLSFNAQMPQGGETWVPYLEAQGQALRDLAEDLHFKALSEIFTASGDLPQLSPREYECLKWTSEGKTHTEIAIILNLSEHTVRSYLKVARIKLDSVSRAQAVAKASAIGLI